MKVKFVFLIILILFCSACSKDVKLSDYPALNDEVGSVVDELNEGGNFNDITYDGFDLVIEEGESMYDVFYSTNCSKMTLSFSEDFKLGWIIYKKNDVCEGDEVFSKDVWDKQVFDILSLERFGVSDDSFPGITGDTLADYKKHMEGKSDKESITTDNGIMIAYDPDIYLFGIFDTNI